jgi:hypothetical protein
MFGMGKAIENATEMALLRSEIPIVKEAVGKDLESNRKTISQKKSTEEVNHGRQ